MKTLTESLIQTVRVAFKGKRLEKFDASLAILRESIGQGAWTPRGSVKAKSGLYQGISNVSMSDWESRGENGNVCTPEWYAATGLRSTLRFGGRLRFMEASEEEWSKGKDFNGLSEGQKLELGYKVLKEHCGLKLDYYTVTAWVLLCGEIADICALLDSARPLPVVTAIGLSPKVTKTLKEMNLDIDLPSVKPAKIDFRMVPGYKWSEQQKKLVPLMENGQHKLVREYFVAWTPGIKHGRSRFASGCEACGKHIPSGRYVPIEATDKAKGELVSFWLGCDCARNIFGVKDVGIEKKEAA